MVQTEKDVILKQAEFVMLGRPQDAKEYTRCCKMAEHYGVAAVCVPSSWVRFCRELLPETVNVCAVVGYPAGQVLPEVKLYEASLAIKHGASEIELVPNVGYVLSAITGNENNGELYSLETSRAKKILDPEWSNEWFDSVRWEIEQIRRICTDGIALRVPIRNIERLRMVKLYRAAVDLGVDYIRDEADVSENGLPKECRRSGTKIIATRKYADLDTVQELLRCGYERVSSPGLMNTLVVNDTLASAIRAAYVDRPYRPTPDLSLYHDPESDNPFKSIAPYLRAVNDEMFYHGSSLYVAHHKCKSLLYARYGIAMYVRP